MENVHALPGVRDVTVDDSFPFLDMYEDNVQIAAQPIDKRVTIVHFTQSTTSRSPPKPCVQGHFLDNREIAEGSSHDVQVTENFAHRYFNGEKALDSVFICRH